jgi:hypothetical protein
MRFTRAHLFAAPLALTVAGSLLGGIPTQAAAESRARVTVDRTIRDTTIRESSGLTRSTYNRPLLWTHNDSGDSARVYAIRQNGTTRGVIRLRGASSRDWEDISSGPRHKIWVGDIGDNARRRSTISVYRFREPKVASSRAVKSTRFDFRYPDGRHDAEGLMVRPGTGRVFVVTKSRSGGHIYRAPKRLSTRSVNRLQKLGRVPVSITAASFAPGGRRFVVSNHNWAYIYDGLGDRRPRAVRKPDTRQGESMTVTRGGGALLIGSEGVRSPVYRLRLN